MTLLQHVRSKQEYESVELLNHIVQIYLDTIMGRLPNIYYTKACMPVIARPKISAWISDCPSGQDQRNGAQGRLMLLTISLCHE